MSQQDQLTKLENEEHEPKDRRRWLIGLLLLVLLCVGVGATVAFSSNNRVEATPTSTQLPATDPATFTSSPAFTDTPTATRTDTPTPVVCTADPVDGVCCEESGETYLTSPSECSCVVDPADGVCCTEQGESYPTEPVCPAPQLPQSCTIDPADGLCCIDQGESYPTEPTCQRPDPCAEHGGLQWEGDACACSGVTVHKIICQDGTSWDTVTEIACQPDPECNQGNTDDGSDSGGSGGSGGGGGCNLDPSSCGVNVFDPATCSCIKP